MREFFQRWKFCKDTQISDFVVLEVKNPQLADETKVQVSQSLDFVWTQIQFKYIGVDVNLKQILVVDLAFRAEDQQYFVGLNPSLLFVSTVFEIVLGYYLFLLLHYAIKSIILINKDSSFISRN